MKDIKYVIKTIENNKFLYTNKDNQKIIPSLIEEFGSEFKVNGTDLVPYEKEIKVEYYVHDDGSYTLLNAERELYKLRVKIANRYFTKQKLFVEACIRLTNREMNDKPLTKKPFLYDVDLSKIPLEIEKLETMKVPTREEFEEVQHFKTVERELTANTYSLNVPEYPDLESHVDNIPEEFYNRKASKVLYRYSKEHDIEFITLPNKTSVKNVVKKSITGIFQVIPKGLWKTTSSSMRTK